jgi:hypothetical protein
MLATAAAAVTLPHAAAAVVVAQSGQARVVIAQAADATAAEKTAAAELADYLGQVTGGQYRVVAEGAVQAGQAAVFVGWTTAAREAGVDCAALGPEEWIVRTEGASLLVTGGRPRGTLYAAYRFLEDTVGVHWWTPWAESVPSRPTLEISARSFHGQPVLKYRDIYMLWGNDEGRFAARNRLNRQGDAPVAPRYGGCRDYGPPYHVHTFSMYVPPDQHLGPHPEWFALVGGQRTGTNAQLCLTNPELRGFMVQRLSQYIEEARTRAREAGTPPPDVFSISQNDCGGQCECGNCQAIAKAEGSEAGPIIDFLNYLSDAIRPQYPEVWIDTLAYWYSEVPPAHLRPRDNIIFRLCDTGSNFTKPITDPENTPFREKLEGWAKVARNLRVWDYAVTYAPYTGFPIPTLHTYQTDFQFYATHHVEGVFTEFEYPLITDLRDMKVWCMMKLLEDPYRDVGELIRTFTDGYYGPAAPAVRQYLSLLERAGRQKPAYLSMGGAPRAATYLDLGFFRRAAALFDQTERNLRALSDDPLYFGRLRHARLPVDRAAVVLYQKLLTQWARQGNDAATMPLHREEMADRYLETWLAEAEARMSPEGAAGEAEQARREVAALTARKPFTPLPAQFRGLPPGSVFDFTPEVARNWADIVKVTADPGAESGITLRLAFPTDVDPVGNAVEKYRLPMPWGIYSQAGKRQTGSGTIQPEDVPGPGYHWYKLGPAPIAVSDYLYFFWSWIIQFDIDGISDGAAPGAQYDAWANIKFEGPSFPHGTPDQPDAICVERVIITSAK